MTPVFPDHMIAGCAHGHHWSVEIAWTPMQIEFDGQPCRHVQVPTTISPRYCAACFLDRKGAQLALFLRHRPVYPSPSKE